MWASVSLAPAMRPVTKTTRPVHGDLHAHQGPWLALRGEVDDGVGDPVADLVGMTGADGLCGSASRCSRDRGHGQVHQFTSRVSWRPENGARSRWLALPV